MRERAKSILEVGINHFIRTGSPVTSRCLYEKCDFGIKPAMIRNELNKLGALGYFEQCHPSGGRLPTPKAYRFFVDEILSRWDSKPIGESLLNDSLTSRLFDKETESFIDELSNRLRVLSVGYELESREMFNSGLGDLFDSLDLGVKRDFLKVIEDFELIHKRLDESREWWFETTSWPQVFVGQSPVTRSKHLSVVADRFDLPNANFLVLLIGPMRMDYQKTLNFFKVLERSIDVINR